MVRIFTDSTSDINQAEAKELGVTVVPLKVIFADGEYRDGIDLSPNEFYRKLKCSEKLPTTSQPTPEEFMKKFQEARDAGDEIVAILISGELSGTVQSAHIARERCGEEGIYIVDSRSTILSIRLLVNRAVKLAAEGKSAAEIAADLEEAKKRLRLVAVVDTLEYLKKGGRLSKTAAFAGTLLGIKPVISIEDGVLGVKGKARGLQKAFELVFSVAEEQGGIDISQPVAIGYTGEATVFQDFQKVVAEKLPGIDPVISPVGSVVGTHAGPGACVIVFYAKK